MTKPNWWLDVPQSDNTLPSPTIAPIFITADNISKHASGYVVPVAGALCAIIRNRMSRILLFEFRTPNGAILPVMVDPGETVSINVGFPLVSLTVYDPTQFAVGQAPSSTHLSVPFSQLAAQRFLDSWSYIGGSAGVSTDAQSSGGYALVTLSDQAILVNSSVVSNQDHVNAVAYTDVATSGFVPVTFDASTFINNTANVLAAKLWQGFHAINSSTTQQYTVKYKSNILGDTQYTIFIPPLTIVSLPVEAFEFIVQFNDNTVLQSFMCIQEIARVGTAQP